MLSLQTGDVNGDGYSDVIIGEFLFQAAAKHIYFGRCQYE
ncbi:MAG: FG-GAP repeat protein [Ignavibacteria bacterium]|nr:FG-GAP repeat protein [Ignavibacteria bacterium]